MVCRARNYENADCGEIEWVIISRRLMFLRFEMTTQMKILAVLAVVAVLGVAAVLIGPLGLLNDDDTPTSETTPLEVIRFAADPTPTPGQETTGAEQQVVGVQDKLTIEIVE
jgi:hypothetical protein